MSLPVTAGLLSDRLRLVEHGARDLRVWLLTALIVVLAVGVTATGSRAGFAMLMLSVLAGALVMWRGGRHEGRSSARIWLKVGGAVAGLIIVQFTLFALLARLQADPAEDYRSVMTPLVRAGDLVFPERDDRQHFRVGFVNVGVQSLFDLRRQFGIIAVVPQRLASPDHRRCQCPQFFDLVGSSFNRIQSTDGFDATIAARSDRDT